MKIIQKWVLRVPTLWGGWALLPGCLARSEDGGSAGAKVFLALGICLAAVFLVFYIVIKGREKR